MLLSRLMTTVEPIPRQLQQSLVIYRINWGALIMTSISKDDIFILAGAILPGIILLVLPLSLWVWVRLTPNERKLKWSLSELIMLSVVAALAWLSWRNGWFGMLSVVLWAYIVIGSALGWLLCRGITRTALPHPLASILSIWVGAIAYAGMNVVLLAFM